MSSVIAFISESPSVRRVIEAAALCAGALGLSARFVRFGAQDAEADARLGALVGEATGGGCTVERRGASGRVDEAMLALVRESSPAMIVLGAVRRENGLRDLLGSTARRAALRAPCSALLVSTAGRPAAEWSRYVVCVDESAHAAAMAGTVCRIARAAGPEGAVMFASEQPDLSLGRAPEGTAGGGPTPHRLTMFIEGIDTTGLRAQAAPLVGRAGHEAARFAEDARADLFAVAAPSRPLGLAERVFNHPVSVILDRLPCSTLLYRAAPGNGAAP